MPKTVKTKPAPPPALPVFLIRGQRVILAADLAAIYGVPTKRFNEAIKRNRERFPEDFAFQLTAAETANLQSQFVTSSLQPIDNKSNKANWSQIATSSEAAGDDTDENLTSQFVISSHGGRRTRPWAFTEHGAVMAANLLRSERAVRMSVFVVRVFADSTGRPCCPNRGLLHQGGLRNPQKATNRFDGGFGNRLSSKGGSQHCSRKRSSTRRGGALAFTGGVRCDGGGRRRGSRSGGAGRRGW